MAQPSDTPAGYRPDGPIILVPHDAAWADWFKSEASHIREVLGDILVELHHIGSTAIPGIAAKPVIDMLAVVSRVELLDETPGILDALGYEAMGEFGIAGRRYFRKTSAAGVRTHQLHAFAVGSPEIQRHVDFRDYLRARPEEARSYEILKRDLADTQGKSIDAYSEGKTALVRKLERRAALWRVEGRRPESVVFELAMTGEEIDRHRGRAIGFAYLVSLVDAVAWGLTIAGVELPITWRTGLDAILFLVLAWGVSQNSRIAACALCVYWALTRIVVWLQFERVSVLMGLLVLGYFFVQGARAVFAFHSNRRLRIRR